MTTEIADDSALFDSIADEMEGRNAIDDTDETQPEVTEAPEQEAAAEPEAQDELTQIKSQLAELQRERDDWRHRYQSDEGRFKAAQRTLQEVHQQRLQPQQQTRDQQEQAEIAKAGVEALKAGKFDEFAGEFPEMAEAIQDFYRVREEQIFSKLQQELTPLKEAYQRQREIDQEAAFNSAAEQLAARHPDWQQYHRDSNADFGRWLNDQPPEIQSLYGRPDARAASRLIDIYKMDRAPAQQPAPQAPTKSDQIARQRKAKLERSALPTTRSGSVTDDDSDSAMWNAMAAKVDRQNRR